MPEIPLDPEHAVLTIDGCLDADTGEALVQAAHTAVEHGTARLEIDLCSITDYTEEGARSLVVCRSLCSSLPGGLHYRTGQGPGREALLLAYADE